MDFLQFGAPISKEPYGFLAVWGLQILKKPRGFCGSGASKTKEALRIWAVLGVQMLRKSTYV